jgi:hypothetical protein
MEFNFLFHSAKTHIVICHRSYGVEHINEVDRRVISARTGEYMKCAVAKQRSQAMATPVAQADRYYVIHGLGPTERPDPSLIITVTPSWRGAPCFITYF